MTDIRHAPECPGADLKPFTGAHGDPMELCRACGRVRVIQADETQPPPTSPTTSRWRCREHGAPVNWRGRGCARCDAPPPSKAERRARRLAAREALR